MITTTLKKIRECDPCEKRWKTLLKHLGVTSANRDKLLLETILDSNGIYDAHWTIGVGAIDFYKKHEGAIYLYDCFLARYALFMFEEDHPEDKRPREAINILEQYAWGKATIKELEEAQHQADLAARTCTNWPSRYAAWFACGYWGYASHSGARARLANTARTVMYADFSSRGKSIQQVEADFTKEFRRLCNLEGKYGLITKEKK